MTQRTIELVWYGEEMVKLFQFLDLKAPVQIDIIPSKNNEMYGSYNHQSRVITIQVAAAMYDRSPLGYVIREIRKTVLHELRHAHQYDHWSGDRLAKDKLLPYPMREIEMDAVRFEEENKNQWRLFSAKTSQIRKKLPG